MNDFSELFFVNDLYLNLFRSIERDLYFFDFGL
jgi:hypothetical protein